MAAVPSLTASIGEIWVGIGGEYHLFAVIR
jgi:hypothetical protein